MMIEDSDGDWMHAFHDGGCVGNGVGCDGNGALAPLRMLFRLQDTKTQVLTGLNE